MSPILIENTVQIPEGEILEIQKEVEIVCDENKNVDVACFLVHGNLKVNQKVKIEANNRILVSANDAPGGFVDIDSAEISGAFTLFNAPGTESFSFSVVNSILSNISRASTLNRIWNKDLILRNNTFIDASGFYFGGNQPDVMVRRNIFIEKNKFISKQTTDSPWIELNYIVTNYSTKPAGYTLPAFGDGMTIKNNSFLSGGIIVEVKSSKRNCSWDPCNIVDLSKNFWDTNDINKINEYILDYNDSIALAGPLNFIPILQEPHSDVGHNH